MVRRSGKAICTSGPGPAKPAHPSPHWPFGPLLRASGLLWLSRLSVVCRRAGWHAGPAKPAHPSLHRPSDIAARFRLAFGYIYMGCGGGKLGGTPDMPERLLPSLGYIGWVALLSLWL